MGMDLEEGWFSADIQSRLSTGGDLGVHGSFLQVMTGVMPAVRQRSRLGLYIRDVAKS